MRNAEGKMRNGMCGMTVIGRDVTPRDRSHSAFNPTPCVECMEVKCILNQTSAVAEMGDRGHNRHGPTGERIHA